jgi:pyruvate/2-oxoglutarate dehydrogenase complex dihydrolipoamide dehydrogenase (E3) component
VNVADHSYDLLVIGGGPAGSSAVDNLKAQGHKLALVEKDKLGGTCLNYGCDPTKTLLYIASQMQKARQANRLGLEIPHTGFDWGAVQGRVQKVLEQLRGGSLEEADKGFEGASLYKGPARFVAPHEIEVNGQRLRAERVIIASGTSPAVPPIEGLAEAGFITNVEAVSLETLPKRLAVLGGGPIGMEFAQVFRQFGVEVTVLEKAPHLLDTEDREMAGALVSLLTRSGISFKTGVELTCVRQEDSGKRLTIQHDDGRQAELVVDEILVAIGRKPDLEGLNLVAAGVETTEKGIKVDKNLRTTAPHIWAAGDIASKYQFTHIASAQGKLAARNAFAAAPELFDDSLIPWGVYTYPSLGHVGRTEEELRDEGQSYRVVRHPFKEVVRAVTDNQTEGMVKLLAAPDGRILGGHILADQAGDLLAPVVLAMKAGLKVKDLAETIQPYPTLAEAVVQAAAKLQKLLS